MYYLPCPIKLNWLLPMQIWRKLSRQEYASSIKVLLYLLYCKGYLNIIELLKHLNVILIRWSLKLASLWIHYRSKADQVRLLALELLVLIEVRVWVMDMEVKLSFLEVSWHNHIVNKRVDNTCDYNGNCQRH